jgi:hypothetical protein
MACLAILALPSTGVIFFFRVWIGMVFWDIIANAVGESIPSAYMGAMLGTIAMWMAMGRRCWLRQRVTLQPVS